MNTHALALAIREELHAEGIKDDDLGEACIRVILNIISEQSENFDDVLVGVKAAAMTMLDLAPNY